MPSRHPRSGTPVPWLLASVALVGCALTPPGAHVAGLLWSGALALQATALVLALRQARRDR